MAGLLKWLQAGSSRLLDPDRDKRVQAAALCVERELARQRSAFSLEAATRGLDLFTDDRPLVARETYRSLLRRAWRDGSLSEGEVKTLHWAAGALHLDQKASEELQREVGLSAFQELLARAVDDGVLSDDEIAHLQRAASGLSWKLPDMMRHYFAAESSGLLRGMFAKTSEDGTVVANEWRRLIGTARKLGLSDAELLSVIQPQAERFVEQTLADAKSDERISLEEESNLTWLTTTLILNPEFRSYVHAQVERVKLLESVASGRLPSIRSSRLGLRAGEIVHAETPARFLRTRQLKSGPRQDAFDGTLTLTDDRLLFHSTELGCEVNHRRVMEIQAYRNGFDLTASGKGTGTYIPITDPTIFVRIYRAAVQKANQTIVSGAEKQSGRHIPRDVRQRVWQRYGGQCADCGAKDYLEFDHIIPVAKGGGNSEANVQLLCRRCNGSKSDMV